MIISAASWQADLGILEQKLGEYFRRYFRGSLGLVICQTLLDPHHLEGLYLMGVGWQTASTLTVGKHKENWVVSTRRPRKAKRNTFSVFLTRWRMVSSDWLLEGWELQFCKPSAMLGREVKAFWFLEFNLLFFNCEGFLCWPGQNDGGVQAFSSRADGYCSVDSRSLCWLPRLW